MVRHSNRYEFDWLSAISHWHCHLAFISILLTGIASAEARCLLIKYTKLANATQFSQNKVRHLHYSVLDARLFSFKPISISMFSIFHRKMISRLKFAHKLVERWNPNICRSKCASERKNISEFESALRTLFAQRIDSARPEAKLHIFQNSRMRNCACSKHNIVDDNRQTKNIEIWMRLKLYECMCVCHGRWLQCAMRRSN